MRAYTAFSVTLAVAGAVFAQAPGDTLLDQVKQAYSEVKQYEASPEFKVVQQQGRWTNTQQAEYRIAFDREAGKLLIDKPDLYMVVDGGKLMLRSDSLPGHHLDTAAPSPLTYEALLAEVPYVGRPALADVAFLLAADPVAAVAEMPGATAATLAPAAGSDAPRLQIGTSQGVLTLTIDPKTHLITHSELAIDTSQMGAPAGSSMTVSYDINNAQRNVALDDKLFAFDASNSKAAGSMQDMINNAQAGAGNGNAGGGQQQHQLTGKDAPAIESSLMDGSAFKLADLKEDVVVIDFWASWCGPCRRGLPKVQEVAQWAKDQNKSVKVLTVNVGETVADAKAFWKEHGFTMPVVMDQDGKISNAYGVSGIPQTVVIANGKVHAVHVGFSEQLGQQLQSDIEAALAAAE